jgi:clan AA aspartic protease (TIGR02281 family)
MAEPPPVAGVVAAFLIAGALGLVALVRVAEWGSGASSATPDPPQDVVQSRHAPDPPPSDTMRYYHGQQTSEIDGDDHCSATAWAETSGGDGSFRVELDSGAGAALWLTRDDAARIGIDVGSLNFDEDYRGISGPGQGAVVTLAQFRLGGVTLHDVRAIVISETDGTDRSLVGLPILRHLNFHVVDNSCVLSW